MSIVNSKDRARHALGVVQAPKVLPIEFPFLKDALTGFLDTDFMLVGARSGKGKTSMLTEIALSAAQTKKKVVFFALEAEESEIEMRIQYQLLSKFYFEDPGRDRGAQIDYRSWRLGRLNHVFAPYEDSTLAWVDQNLGTLVTSYRGDHFTFEDFQSQLDGIRHHNPDLVIVDHLHYFDLGSGRGDKNEKMSQLAKQIRGLNLEYRIPFICAAHVRKDVERIVPDQEDFMGSSDIFKVATSIVMFGASPGGYSPKAQAQETLMSIPKARTGGIPLVAKLTFSYTYQCYAKEYTLGTLSPDGKRFTEIEPAHYPHWARFQRMRLEELAKRAGPRAVTG